MQSCFLPKLSINVMQGYFNVSQASIIRGLVADGAVEQTVLSSLCSEEALAPWTTTNEVISELHLSQFLVAFINV